MEGRTGMVSAALVGWLPRPQLMQSQWSQGATPTPWPAEGKRGRSSTDAYEAGSPCPTPLLWNPATGAVMEMHLTAQWGLGPQGHRDRSPCCCSRTWLPHTRQGAGALRLATWTQRGYPHHGHPGANFRNLNTPTVTWECKQGC